MIRKIWSIILLVVLTAVFSNSTLAKQETRRPNLIEWPNEEFPTLQSAVDALPDGGVLKIKAGIFDIQQPIFVKNNRLEIIGTGSGRNDRGRVTHLAGPLPQPVVDVEGNVVLHANAVIGMFNFIGAEVVIHNLKLTGFDAAIVTRDDEAGISTSVLVENLFIDGTGRGILGLSSGQMTIKDSEIQNTLWHGISVTQPLNLSQTRVLNPQCAGLYFENVEGPVLMQN